MTKNPRLAAIVSLYAATAIVVGIADTARADPGDPLYWVHASDAFGDDGFGFSMAVSGNRGLFGATDGNNRNQHFGSAYLFDVATSQQLRKLTPSDTATNDRFGYSVALDPNTALVGAAKDSSPGAVYVFDANTGLQLKELNASDKHSDDDFGSAVAISGNRAIVGAFRSGPWCGYGYTDYAGAAYIFDIATGQQLLKLTASDPQARDYFGWSVAISGDKAIVGAWNNYTSSLGAAYVFDVNTGQQLYKLTAPPYADELFEPDFGYSLALNGNLALIGVPRGLDDHTNNNTGSAYLFDLTTGQEVMKFNAADDRIGDRFGTSVALGNNMALIGAVGGPYSQNRDGKAYLFDLTTGREIAKLANPDCCVDAFGYAVALGVDSALISEPILGDYREGRVYTFSTAPEPGTIALAALTLALLLKLPVRLRSKRRGRSGRANLPLFPNCACRQAAGSLDPS